jgi:hypothetical protein
MQLFPDSELITRKSTNQQEFEESIKGEHAVNIVTACSLGVSKAKALISLTSRTFQNRNFCSNLVNSYIQGFLTEEYVSESVFCKGRRFCVRIDGHQLFCKKLDKKFRPSNIKTKAVVMYNEQKSKDEGDVLPITYIGYQLSPNYCELIGVYAVHISGENIEWISDLIELAVSDNCTTLDVRNINEEIDISVTPKKNIGLRRAK